MSEYLLCKQLIIPSDHAWFICQKYKHIVAAHYHRHHHHHHHNQHHHHHHHHNHHHHHQIIIIIIKTILINITIHHPSSFTISITFTERRCLASQQHYGETVERILIKFPGQVGPVIKNYLEQFQCALGGNLRSRSASCSTLLPSSSPSPSSFHWLDMHAIVILMDTTAVIVSMVKYTVGSVR